MRTTHFSSFGVELENADPAWRQTPPPGCRPPQMQTPLEADPPGWRPLWR